MELKTIHIDDDPELLDKASQIINGHTLGDHTIIIEDSADFDVGMDLIEKKEYDLIILDLCIGKASEESDKVGEEIYNRIKALTFAPIIFYTGLPQYVDTFTSDIVRVVSKGDGYDQLFEEIEALLVTKYLDIKLNVNKIVKESLRSFFWDFVHPKKEIIDQIKDEVSLSYILLRRLANMLSKDHLVKFINEEKLSQDLAHPIEFYIYPPLDGELETGDIIKHKETNEVFVILTPSCDLIDRGGGHRKADKILLVGTKAFEELDSFTKYNELKESLSEKPELSKEDTGKLKNLKKQLGKWMSNNGGAKDRYFFLPNTPFIKPLLIDFQYKSSVKYAPLQTDFDRIARLDDPFAQSMLSSFTRYYNRVGFPDLDIEYSLSELLSEES